MASLALKRNTTQKKNNLTSSNIKETETYESNALSDRYMRSAYYMESLVTWLWGTIIAL